MPHIYDVHMCVQKHTYVLYVCKRTHMCCMCANAHTCACIARVCAYQTYGVATIIRLLKIRLLKIVGLFCKEPYQTHDILQKIPKILRSLLTIPHMCAFAHICERRKYVRSYRIYLQLIATHCNTLRHALQHSATRTATLCKTKI